MTELSAEFSAWRRITVGGTFPALGQPAKLLRSAYSAHSGEFFLATSALPGLPQ
jgi:hypothetical protein